MRLGLTLAEYEDITPAELVLLLRVHRQREDDRRKEREADLYALALPQPPPCGGEFTAGLIRP